MHNKVATVSRLMAIIIISHLNAIGLNHAYQASATHADNLVMICPLKVITMTHLTIATRKGPLAHIMDHLTVTIMIADLLTAMATNLAVAVLASQLTTEHVSSPTLLLAVATICHQSRSRSIEGQNQRSLTSYMKTLGNLQG